MARRMPFHELDPSEADVWTIQVQLPSGDRSSKPSSESGLKDKVLQDGDQTVTMSYDEQPEKTDH